MREIVYLVIINQFSDSYFVEASVSANQKAMFLTLTNRKAWPVIKHQFLHHTPHTTLGLC